MSVKGGRFTITMGATKPLDAAAFKGLGGGWLGIKVGTDPELPTAPLHSVPFALRAQVAHTLNCDGCPGQGTSAVPSGNNGPGYIAVGPIGDDHPNTTTAGYACCL